jgi:hypothetical protein
VGLQLEEERLPKRISRPRRDGAEAYRDHLAKTLAPSLRG